MKWGVGGLLRRRGIWCWGGVSSADVRSDLCWGRVFAFVSFWLFLPSLKAAVGEVLGGCWKAPQPGRKTFLWDRVNIVSGLPTQLVPKPRNLPGKAWHPGDPQEECGMRGLGGEPSFQLSPALLLLLLQPLSPLSPSLPLSDVLLPVGSLPHLYLVSACSPFQTYVLCFHSLNSILLFFYF